jgi:hypothetical protein
MSDQQKTTVPGSELSFTDLFAELEKLSEPEDSCSRSKHYQAFLDAKTKMEAVSELTKYLRTAWKVPPSKDESAPGPV